MVLDQGYWPHTGATPPDGEALQADLDWLWELGFTGVRKHQKTEDPRWLARADRMGLLVWAELPSAYRPGPTSAARLLREWAELVAAHRGHPSVVTWVPVNEGWGVPEAETDPAQRALVWSRYWRRSCAASSMSLCRHSEARYTQAISPVRCSRRRSP